MLVLAVVTLLWAGGSLIARAARQTSDFSLFYRSAMALHEGATPEFYGERDPRGEPRSTPPPGTAFWAYMPFMSITGAAAVWYAFNVGLLVLSAWCLWRIFCRLDRQRRLYRRTWLWVVIVLVFLSADGVQVGQFSVLFVTCWLLYLLIDHGLVGACLLMLPAVIKVYPALLLAVPPALRRYGQTLWLLPAGVLTGIVLPLVFYGRDLWWMWDGFLRYALVGRLEHMLRPWVVTNQSLDNLLYRLLTDQPQFNEAYPFFPHLHLHPALVMHLTVALKLGLLLLTAVAAWRLGSRVRTQPRWTAMLMLGLWSVALVLLLPENKAPYITYCFPAWLPVLAAISAQRNRWRYVRDCTLVALALICQVQLMPHVARVFMPSLVATAALGVVLLRMAWKAHVPAAEKPESTAEVCAPV